LSAKLSLPKLNFVPSYLRVKQDRPPTYKDRERLLVGGHEHTYWQAPFTDEAPRPDGPLPLLIGLHGFGSTGSRLGWWSGLGTRAPAAGFLAVFPDATGQVWDDHGTGRLDGRDDYQFLAALVDHLVETENADPERIFITGVSTGATVTERLIRTGIVHARAAALVCGTARSASRDVTAIAVERMPLLMFAGTRDPMVPYAGGDPTGVLGRVALHTVAKFLIDPSGHDSVGPERLAAEWAAVNGCHPIPEIDDVETDPGDPLVRRMSWLPADPAGAPVIYYRMDGGGHGWPSGKQYLPIKLIGMIPQHFDATAIVLDFAREHLGIPAPASTD